MKKIKVKLCKLLIASLAFVSVIGTVPVMATTEVTKVTEYVEIMPFADIIQRHFATFDGVLHFRDWNATRGRWMNDWTPVW